MTVLGDWPPSRPRARATLSRFLAGDGIDIGPGSNPFPVPYPGVTVRFVDRYDPEANAELFPELEGATFPVPDVVCDLDTDRLGKFGDESLDFAIASHVLEHVAEPIGLLVDMHRVLRPGGVALILLPDRHRTFDRGRPPTPLDLLVRKYEAGETTVPDAAIDEFLRFADPGGVSIIAGNVARDGPETYHRHRERSIHVHCWTEDEFSEVLCYVVRTLACRWEFLDGLIAEDESPVTNEFGYVLRKTTDGTDVETVAMRFESSYSRWVADRRALHAGVAAVSGGVSAAGVTELERLVDAYRKRRVVRAADWAKQRIESVGRLRSRSTKAG